MDKIHDNWLMELTILNHLWGCGKPASLTEIVQATDGEPSSTTATIKDLARKGLVAKEGGNYRPLLGASEFCVAEVRGLVEQLYGGDAVTFLIDYISTASPEERAVLADAIKQGDWPS